MTTTELIALLRENEFGGASGRPREVSFCVGDRIISTDGIEVTGSGDGLITDLDLSLPDAEPKKGKWIVTSEFEDCRYVKCNQCKVTQVLYYNKPLTDFCPNCGADMRGGETT